MVVVIMSRGCFVREQGLIEAIVVEIVDIVTTEAAISDFVDWIVDPGR